MNAVLIFNEQAGSLAAGNVDPASPTKLREAFAAVGVDVFWQPVAGENVGEAVAAAMVQRPDAIFVGGGDGTISAAASRLIEGDIPLGVLPLGTLNHFAHDLGVPPAWRDAVDALATAPTRRVDVGEVNGRIFINNCSIGSYAEAVRRRDALRRTHGHGKWLAMILASFAVFRELRRMRLQAHLPGRSVAWRTPFLLVANNRYSGRVLDASLRPRLDEGRLWFYTTRAKRRYDLLRMAWQSLWRNIDDADALEVHVAAQATITTAYHALPAAADGEVLSLPSTMQFRIRPAALRVLAPESATAR